MQLRGWENDRPSCFHLGFTEKLIPGNDGKYIAQKSYRRIHEAIKPYRCWKGKQFLSRHSSWSALASLRLSNSQRNVDFPTSNAPAYCEPFDVMEKHCVNASSNKISILRRTEKKKANTENTENLWSYKQCIGSTKSDTWSCQSCRKCYPVWPAICSYQMNWSEAR